MHVSVLNEPIRVTNVLDEVEPNLLLLDVVMPGLSGYDVWDGLLHFRLAATTF